MNSCVSLFSGLIAPQIKAKKFNKNIYISLYDLKLKKLFSLSIDIKAKSHSFVVTLLIKGNLKNPYKSVKLPRSL